MKTYDVSCPCCGHRNKDLYLEETEGWMECEKCGEVAQVSKHFEKRSKIPVFPSKSSANFSRAGIENLSPSRSVSLSHSTIGKALLSAASRAAMGKLLYFSKFSR